MLDTNSVTMVDALAEVFIWVGELADDYEKRQALNTAMKYLDQNSRPAHTPIHVYKENSKISDPLWSKIFSN